MTLDATDRSTARDFMRGNSHLCAIAEGRDFSLVRATLELERAAARYMDFPGGCGGDPCPHCLGAAAWRLHATLTQLHKEARA